MSLVDLLHRSRLHAAFAEQGGEQVEKVAPASRRPGDERLRIEVLKHGSATRGQSVIVRDRQQETLTPILRRQSFSVSYLASPARHPGASAREPDIPDGSEAVSSDSRKRTKSTSETMRLPRWRQMTWTTSP